MITYISNPNDTLEVLKKYNDVVNKVSTEPEKELNKEEQDLFDYIEIYLAKSLIKDFDEKTLRKLSKILLNDC